MTSAPRSLVLAAWAVVSLAVVPAPAAAQPPAVLVYTATAGFRHDSIAAGVATVSAIGAAQGFAVTHTEDPDAFTDDGLRGYGAVAFLLTSGDVLNSDQEAALERFVRGGGGFVGVHSATDTEYSWPFYRVLVGAHFQSHPAIQAATLRVEGTHASTSGLAADWMRVDEWYNFDANPRGDVRVLATLDESTYTGGTMGSDHPIAWYRQVDRGRAWYTALGHTVGTYSEPAFVDHLAGGLRWALGRQKHRDLDGDGLADIGVFRPATGGWFHVRSRDGAAGVTWGAPGDIPVTADYDGDGRTDMAVFRPGSPAAFYVAASRGGAWAVVWGTGGDVPVPADYDGDGRADVAVFRATGASAAFFVRPSAVATTAYGVAWGAAGDLPVPADYDGDGRADVAVFRPASGTWFVAASATPSYGAAWGTLDDVPAPRDVDGDGRADLVVFRPAIGAWFVARSRGGAYAIAWGQPGDLVP